jgi:hypothetical protein
VVLRSGKQLYGKLVGEDSATIQLHDSSGVFISIKKSIVDVDATLRANTVVSSAKPSIEASTPSQPPQKTVAEVAREVRETRTGNSRVYTREDLNSVPEVTFGSSSEVEYTKTVDEKRKEEVHDESHWRKIADDFRKELAGLRERKISAEFSCAKAREKRSNQIYGGNRRPSDLSQAFEQPPECKRLSEIESQLSDALWRWDEFTERARKSGVPIAWVE